MHITRTSFGYLLRLDAGEELISTLGAFCQKEQVQGAALNGIGTVRRATLGYFDLGRREYDKRELPDDLELVSLSGNLTWFEGEPVIHAHAVVSGPDFVAHAGHLFSAEIAATAEVFLWTTGERTERALDERTGLRLISR